MTMLLAFDDEAPLAQRLADALDFACCVIDQHTFPDGETRLRLPPVLPAHTVVLRGLQQPNAKLTLLLLAAAGARELGAARLTLVSPYLAYMRQDMEFSPGEAVSQRVVGRFLAGQFDAIVTVDPHLHRVATLQEAAPVAHAIVLTGAGPLSDLIVQRRDRPLLVGPDSESEQWVAFAAARHGLQYTVCSKVRSGDREVAIALPPGLVDGRPVVILDDMASTGHTVAAAARLLRAAGAASIDVAVTHALLAPGALDMLRASGIGEFWSTDCVAHPTNAVSMAPGLAQALRDIAQAEART